jgi:hypothetical protein
MMYDEFKAIAETCATLDELKMRLFAKGQRSFIPLTGDLWAGREVRYGHITRWEQWIATIKDGKIITWCCP